MTLRHVNSKVVYKCRGCDKTGTRCHPIACHAPKCKGVTSPAKGGLKCDWCEKRFATERGVSQHKRHTHPADWNREKIRARKRVVTRGVRGRAWRKGEGSFLDRLNKIAEADEIAKKELQTRGEQGSKSLPPEGGSPTGASGGEGSADGRVRDKAVLEISTQGEQMEVGNKMSADDKIEKMYEVQVDTECEESIRILGLVNDADYDDISTDQVAVEILTTVGRKEGDPAGKRRCERTSGEQPAGSKRRRMEKVNRYKSCQNLYKSDKSALATMILDGKEAVHCKIPMELIDEAFRGRWEAVSGYRGMGRFESTKGSDTESVWRPVIPLEVTRNLKRMRNGSAPGPDGITKADLQGWDKHGEVLAREYTRWMLQGRIPPQFKECKTTLIPKSTDEKELREISNWRPVTIGSLILRLFGRILTLRLAKACPLNPRQRGFLAGADGCAENLTILDKLIGKARAEKSLAIVFVDFARAFDSVSHDHILAVLAQRGMGGLVYDVVKDSYTDCRTTICCGGARSEPITMRVGVKQGDPMSPLLFNLAMDPLINEVETNGWGLDRDGVKIASLVFADDLALVCGSRMDMARQLEVLENFCDTTGLRAQPKKCYGFMLEGGTVNAEGPWLLNEARIQMVDPEQTVKYLGVQVGPDKGVSAPGLEDKLEKWLTNITRADLKPSQWITILNTFTLPRVTYQAVLGKLSMNALSEMDRRTRKAVKSWLHLAPTVNNGLLYSRVKDGGLGITRLE